MILNELGIEIIRFTNEDVIKKTDWVISQIKSKIELIQQNYIEKLNRNSIAGQVPFRGFRGLRKTQKKTLWRKRGWMKQFKN